MATIAVTVTKVPTAIADLVDDTTYILQNKSNYEIYLEEAADAPTDSSKAFRLTAHAYYSRNGATLDVATIKKVSGEDWYVWIGEGSGGSSEIVLGSTT